MKFQTVEVTPDTAIEYTSNELLFLGASGQPYRGALSVRFITKTQSIDLRDFKKYITSLRAQTFIAENIAYEIFHTIDSAIDTKNLGVVIDLSARGGIQQRISFGEPFTPTAKPTMFQVGLG